MVIYFATNPYAVTPALDMAYTVFYDVGASAAIISYLLIELVWYPFAVKLALLNS